MCISWSVILDTNNNKYTTIDLQYCRFLIKREKFIKFRVKSRGAPFANFKISPLFLRVETYEK